MKHLLTLVNKHKIEIFSQRQPEQQFKVVVWK